MKVEHHTKSFTTFEEAFEAAKPYLQQETGKANAIFKNPLVADMPVPQHAWSSRWKQTPEALENTLRYIFNRLSYKCYMLCVGNDSALVYRLVSTDLAPPLRKRLDHVVEHDLDKNKLITDKHRARIRKMASQPARILQCVLKPALLEAPEAKSTDNEYVTLLNGLNLPRGVYILNLSDAVLLERHMKDPFPMIMGKDDLEPEFAKRDQIPVFSLSGAKKYNDITLPNYDDIFIVLGLVNPKFDTFTVEWDKKTIHKAVFRGGPSGCGYTKETNQRIHLASLKHPLLDAAIVGKGATIDSGAIKFDPVHGLGMMNTGIKPAPGFMTMADQSKYRYIIHVDGNVNAYRLLTTMMTGSTIIRVDSKYESWADHLMKPGIHYVLVKPDLSDLTKKLKWLEAHPRTAAKIGKAGYDLAKSLLDRKRIEAYVEKLFWATTESGHKLPRALTQKRKLAKALSKTMKVSDKVAEPVAEPAAVEPMGPEIIDMPSGAKRCPKGYNSVNIKGTKKCKKQKEK